jgi:putative nucleotidyltransferase with HDIG domain
VLPHVAAVALKLASDPEAQIQDVAQLVDTDPPIAARFLSVANSVSYWRGWLAESTHAAIVRLGLANTRDLLFQVVYASSTTGLKKYHAQVQDCFRQSVDTAVAARTISRKLGIDTEYDYMCGLLHNIGEARILRILDELAIKPESKEQIGHLVSRYHCPAGAEVAMAWKLPTAIVDACAAHHDVAAASVPHVRLVMIADLLVAALPVGIASGAPKLDLDGLAALGLDESSALALYEDVLNAARNSRSDAPRYSRRPSVR